VKRRFGLIVFTAVIATVVGSLQMASAVTYGDNVNVPSQTMPAVVSLWVDVDGELTFSCTATLIEQQIAVTAAHCIQGEYREMTVWVGNNRVYDSLGKGHLVDASWFNPRYSDAKLANDVGILHLATPANIPKSKLARLDGKTRLDAKTKFILAGWGDDQNEDVGMLHKVSLKLKNSEAKNYFGTWFNEKTQVAVGKRISSEGVYAGACTGDSGGPLYILKDGRINIVGVTSYGAAAGCGIGVPSVFSRVSYYEKAMKKGIKEAKETANMNRIARDAALAQTPLTGTFTLDSNYHLLASVSASTASVGSLKSLCFFIDDRPATASEIWFATDELPFSASSDGCFYRESDSDLSSGDVYFNDGLALGSHTMYAVVTDSFGRMAQMSTVTFTCDRWNC